MEKDFERKEYVPQFEIKFGVESSEKAVRQKFLNGNIIQFIGTKNLNLYLTHMGHERMRHAASIDWDEITVRGYARRQKAGALGIYYSKDTPAVVERVATQALTDFFKAEK